MGSRVKYLVDTPEMIWGYLDEHDYMESAGRYLRASQVGSRCPRVPPAIRDPPNSRQVDGPAARAHRAACGA